MSKQKNNNLYYNIAIILLIFIALWAYLLGKKSCSNQNIVKQTTQESITSPENNESMDVLVYDDSRCTNCNTNLLIDRLKTIPKLKNAKFIIKDYNTDPEVKKYLQDNNINQLPIFIFDTNKIEPELDKYLNKDTQNKYFVIWWGFDPFAKDKLSQREEKPKTLEVFTMWYCPFGELALKALPQIKEQFKNDDIKIDIHYIADKTGTGYTANDFRSLHWVPEAEENIRQLCIKKYYGIDKLISYAVERYKNADNYGRITDNPKEAMKAVGIDVNKIEQCINSGEWAKLLEEDIKLAQELGIGASPTWLANNKNTFGGIQAQNIQQQFCEYNSDLEGCKTEIKNATTTQNWTPACGN